MATPIKQPNQSTRCNLHSWIVLGSRWIAVRSLGAEQLEQPVISIWHRDDNGIYNIYIYIYIIYTRQKGRWKGGIEGTIGDYSTRVYRKPLLHRFSAAVEFYKQWNTSAKCPFTLLYRRRNFIAHRRGIKSDWNASVPRLLPILAICVCSRYGTNTRSDHRMDGFPVETPLARQVGLISSWLVREVCPSWMFFFQSCVASTLIIFCFSFETVWNVSGLA